MQGNLLAGMLTALWSDFRSPVVLWQLAALALAVCLGWALARLVRSNPAVQDARGTERGAAVQLGLDSFDRVLPPLLVLGFTVVARYALGAFQPVPILKLAIPVTASWVLIRFAFYLLRHVFARHGTVSSALAMFEKVFALLVWLGAAVYLTGLWPDVREFLDTTRLPLGRHQIALSTILQAAASVVVLVIAALWAGAALEARLMAMDGMHTSLRVVMARTGRALLILVAVLLSLGLVGIDLTVLSVFGGALGVGLGLGLQKIASNYVSGFIILLERSGIL